MIPCEPLDGPDTAYGRLYKGMEKDPYKDASIQGFQPYEPYCEEVAATTLLSVTSTSFPSHFPTLAELNAEIDDWTSDKRLAIEADNNIYEVAEAYLIPTIQPVLPTPSVPTPPLIGNLLAKLLSSADCLFFITHNNPGTTVSN